jgi:hypothetical protein
MDAQIGAVMEIPFMSASRHKIKLKAAKITKGAASAHP